MHLAGADKKRVSTDEPLAHMQLVAFAAVGAGKLNDLRDHVRV